MSNHLGFPFSFLSFLALFRAQQRDPELIVAFILVLFLSLSYFFLFSIYLFFIFYFF